MWRVHLVSRASFFYCHGTNYLFNIMSPITNSIASLDNNWVLRVFGNPVNEPQLAQATISGVDGKTYQWDLTPANDPFPAMLDSELWDERVMVAYPASQLFGGLSINYGIDRMCERIEALPKGKKFAIGGFSQGAAVASGVYLSGLKPGTSGRLSSKQADFLGAVNFGNPRRQVNHRGLAGQFGTYSGSWYDPSVTTGSGGCFPDSGPYARLTGCEDKWVEFVAPAETITGNGTSPVELQWQSLSGVFTQANDIGAIIAALVGPVRDAAELIGELLGLGGDGDGYGRLFENFFIDAAGQPRNVGGAGHTQYAIYPPPDASGVVPKAAQVVDGVTYYSPIGKTAYQLALEFLNGQAREYQRATSVVAPTISPGWSTTLFPPAS